MLISWKNGITVNDINVNVASNDIEACDRIGKKDTIICSTKTTTALKHAKQALYNKKKLSRVKKKYTFNPNSNPSFISENSTRMHESLAYQGRKLKRNNLINACYTANGIVTIKMNERSKAIKIHHMN